MSARTGLDPRPRVNTPVLLSVPGLGDDLPSRVEDVHDDLVAVAAVTVPGRHARPRPGEVVTLAWTGSTRGLLSVVCVLVADEAGPPPLWLLRPQGPLRRLQRRRFARADVCARVLVVGEASALSGVLEDLGEGGARVLLDAGQHVEAAVGDLVDVEVQLAPSGVAVRARVVGVDVLAAGRRRVRVQFDLPEREADQVRREVLRRQVESRRTEVGA